MEISATTRSLHLISKTSLPSSSSSSSLASTNSLYFNNVSNDLFKKSKKSWLSLNRARAERNGFNCRSMFGLGVPEIAVIAGVTTLLFGPKMVPELGKSIGQTVKSFQQAAKEFESELKRESQSATETLTEVVVSEEQQDA